MFPNRVARKVMTRWTPSGDCWVSTYSVGSHGYAQIGWKDEVLNRTVTTTVHRVAWWAYNRIDIPEGMTVDHICHNRRCVNPQHLRLLSNVDNARDNGGQRTAVPTGRTCSNGHDIVRSAKGYVYCATCKNRRSVVYRQKQKENHPASVSSPAFGFV